MVVLSWESAQGWAGQGCTAFIQSCLCCLPSLLALWANATWPLGKRIDPCGQKESPGTGDFTRIWEKAGRVSDENGT